MAVFRNKRTLVKGALTDVELSLQAKGLLSFLSAFSNREYQLSVDELSEYAKNGRSATRNAFNELMERGYIDRERIRDKGRFVDIIYVIK